MPVSDEPLNGDTSVRVAVDAAAMVWASSPSGSVVRKRLHRVGPAESGQVTSVVRYERQSSFHAHDHPEGEEILVLAGVFSDEHGDWPAGAYLLNPEGFRHAPFSREGCVLFVKLRQFAGERRHVEIRTHELPWKPSATAGIEIKPLYTGREESPAFEEEMRLERWASGAAPGTLDWKGGVEIFVISGSFVDEHGSYEEGLWLRLPAGASHAPSSPGGCELYVKHGAVASLRSA